MERLFFKRCQSENAISAEEISNGAATFGGYTGTITLEYESKAKKKCEKKKKSERKTLPAGHL